MYNKFKLWSNENQGVFAFAALIVAILSLVGINSVNINLDSSKFMLFISYPIQVPVYLALLMILIISILSRRFYNRYRLRMIDETILHGTWKNEWNNQGSKGAEIIRLNKDGSIITDNNIHRFNIKDFKVDINRNQISFLKQGVSGIDTRNLLNVVKIKNNELLEGTENGYEIKYTKLLD